MGKTNGGEGLYRKNRLLTRKGMKRVEGLGAKKAEVLDWAKKYSSALFAKSLVVK